MERLKGIDSYKIADKINEVVSWINSYEKKCERILDDLEEVPNPSLYCPACSRLPLGLQAYEGGYDAYCPFCGWSGNIEPDDIKEVTEEFIDNLNDNLPHHENELPKPIPELRERD